MRDPNENAVGATKRKQMADHEDRHPGAYGTIEWSMPAGIEEGVHPLRNYRDGVFETHLVGP